MDMYHWQLPHIISHRIYLSRKINLLSGEVCEAMLVLWGADEWEKTFGKVCEKQNTIPFFLSSLLSHGNNLCLDVEHRERVQRMGEKY